MILLSAAKTHIGHSYESPYSYINRLSLNTELLHAYEHASTIGGNLLMPYRPEPAHRRNRQGVIYPLTEAVQRLYGARPEDGAYPLGAFYPINVSNSIWRCTGGVWYVANSETELAARNPREETVLAFMKSIQSGESVELPSGISVCWERIPDHEASELRDHSS